VLASHVVVDGDTELGADNRLYPFCSVGLAPQDKKYHGEHTRLVIGDRNAVREFVTIHPGTAGGGGLTRIGSDNLFMAYTHVANDCTIGSHVVLANSVNMGGHVTIEDWAILGGMVGVHQFTRIGRHSIVSFGCKVGKDVAPFVKCGRDPLRTVGLNSVGLTRRGFSSETRLELKRAYRIIFRSGLTVRDAVRRIRSELRPIPEVMQLCAFVEGSERGLTL